MYNNIMTRNYFSKRGGPYFISDGLSKHNDPKPTTVSTIDKIKSFFKSRRRNQK